MNHPTVGILLYGSGQPPRDAFAEDKYRLLAEKMAEQDWEVKTLTYQEVNALYPLAADDDFTRRQPSRRHYYTEECFLFQPLRRRLEDEWIPALLRIFQVQAEDLPLICDADFFFGDTPGNEFLLCEINASCVSPIPESAITPMIGELRRRLEARQAAGSKLTQSSPS